MRMSIQTLTQELETAVSEEEFEYRYVSKLITRLRLLANHDSNAKVKNNFHDFWNEFWASGEKLSDDSLMQKWSRWSWRNMSFNVETCQENEHFLAFLYSQFSPARKKLKRFWWNKPTEKDFFGLTP